MIRLNKNGVFDTIVWDKTIDSFRITGGEQSVLVANSELENVLGMGIISKAGLQIGAIMTNKKVVDHLLKSRGLKSPWNN